MKSTIVLLALALALCACPPSPAPPTPDSGDGAALDAPAPDASDLCSSACANLAALGCKEGADPKCLAVCEQNQASHLTVMPLACWSAASSKAIARACGSATTGHLACP